MAGLGLALALLWFFFRETEWSGVWLSIASASISLLCLSMGLNILSLVIRSYRWQILLRPLKSDIGMYPSWKYFNVGFAVSAILPGRLGEVLRPYLMSRNQNIRFTPTFATVVSERIIDLLAVLAMLTTFLILPDVLGPRADDPSNADVIGTIQTVGLSLLSGVIIGVIFLAFIKKYTEFSLSFIRKITFFLPQKVSEKIIEIIQAFVEGIGGLNAKEFSKMIGITLVNWVVLTGGYYTSIRAFGIDVPFHHMFFFVAVVSLGVIVPTPGGSGTYHAAIMVVAGRLWGFSQSQPEDVAAYAIISHFVAFIPIVTFGTYYIVREGIDVFRTHEEEIEESEDKSKN